MNKGTFEQQLETKGYLVYKVAGCSMAPLLRENRDLVVIRAAGERKYRRYDGVLYRGGERYVLHRILKARENEYTLCGDRCTAKEYGVSRSQILGIMTAYVRDGKERTTHTVRYRVYSHLWCDFFWVRIAVIKSGSLIRSLFGRGRK